MTQISAEAIAIAYDKITIIDDLSLRIPQGEITLLLVPMVLVNQLC